jgi:hypothetical protein
MKSTLLILSLFFQSIGWAQNDRSSEKYNGFEIYLVDNYVANKYAVLDLPEAEHRKLIRKKSRKKNLNKYWSKMPDSICAVMDMEESSLEQKPFLTFEDIKFYDKKSQSIVLTNSGLEKIKNLKANLNGVPCVIIAKENKILPLFIRPSYSSFLKGRYFITLKNTGGFSDNVLQYKISNELNIIFSGCGMDLRESDFFLNNLILME